MKRGGKKFSFRKWCDDWALSLKGVLLATKSPRFWAFFVPVFIIFGTLLDLLSGGLAAFSLMGASDLGGVLKIIFDSFLGLFGINKNFLDWLLIFGIAILQAALIGIIAIIWRHNKDQAAKRKRQRQTEKLDNVAGSEAATGLQNSGIIAGLAILGSGCPTCGTALLTPIIGAVFSGGSVAIAGTVSGIITALAIIIAIFALRRVGLDVYAIIVSKRMEEKNDRN
ncbi:hypothetical protein IJJ18_03010 [Candidatus Saccharibacteria bacterium]|nr:hypothetical protein [Candidatus Saccharibacteria bacterium]